MICVILFEFMVEVVYVISAQLCILLRCQPPQKGLNAVHPQTFHHKYFIQKLIWVKCAPRNMCEHVIWKIKKTQMDSCSGRLRFIFIEGIKRQLHITVLHKKEHVQSIFWRYNIHKCFKAHFSSNKQHQIRLLETLGTLIQLVLILSELYQFEWTQYFENKFKVQHMQGLYWMNDFSSSISMNPAE